MTRVLGYRGGEAIVSVDESTHLVVELAEVVGLRHIIPQLVLVMMLAEREADEDSQIAFECRAARAMFGEHLPGVALPPED